MVIYIMGSYWSFDKHGEHEHEYRGQIASGLVNVLLFHDVSRSYYEFTGRGFEKKHLELYDSYIRISSFPRLAHLNLYEIAIPLTQFPIFML